ncbi:hypothetical protein H7200_02490 [Candidatus Saccharibacteria bacterium]|nr:hypothetical protein [Candidatus Saccharibacteria bacterium]
MVHLTTAIKTHKKSLIRQVLLTPLYVIAFGCLAVAALTTNTYAVEANYDCGTYGAGNYNEVCAESSAATPDPTQTSNNRIDTTPTLLNPSIEPEDVSTVSTPINLDDFLDYSKEGKKFFAQIGQVFNFKLGTEQHSVTIKSFSDTQLIVTIASTPRDVTIPLGRTVNYDVDENGTKDIAIDFGAINGDTVEMTFKKIVAVSTAQSEGEDAPLVASTSESFPWIFVALGVLGLIIITAIVIVSRRKSGVPPQIPPTSL